MTTAGTRREAIKLAPLVRLLARRAHVEHRLIATGQQRTGVHRTLADFAIEADADLALPEATPDAHAEAIGRALPPLLRAFTPDLLIVQGDTSSAWAAALTAAAHDIPIGHVEAGLRRGDTASLWPDERNRREIDGVSTLLFAPSQSAAANLAGLRGEIHVTGSTGIDALMEIKGRQALRLHEAPRKLILVACRRRETLPHLPAICAVLRRLAAREDVALLLPIDGDPAVAGLLRAAVDGVPGIYLEPRLAYPELIRLMGRAYLLLTDSGSLQEAAPALGLPALVLHDVTERPEPVATGNVRLVGRNPERIFAETSRLLDERQHHAAMSRPAFPYGRGDAASRIFQIIERWADLPATILFEPRRAYG
jgi:UDP-N-acetylglucosamine 2-epimerase (non-hydrolysing)